MRFPRPRPAVLTGALALIMAVHTAAPATRAEARGDAAEVPRADHSVRYGPRAGVDVPDGAIVPQIRGLAGTAFSPRVDDVVARLDLPTYDAFLRGLSGWNAVVIGGDEVTFRTRYSLTAAGQACWQFAYETFEALGYEVRYHEYTWNGFQLRNIIATIPGETTPGRIYVLGGHIDSTSPSPSISAPGAEDNGSGSAGVLAAAAALVGERFDSTIELVLFSGEEQGLRGSQAYVNEALANGRDIRSAVTLDMIAAWVDEYGVLIEGETAWQPLMSIFGDAVDTYTSISRQFSYFSFGSDHVPFQNAGIPALLAIDLDWDQYAYYHRTTDTYDHTTPALGVEIARAALATVAHQAGPLGPPLGAPLGGWASAPGPFPNPASERVTVPFVMESGNVIPGRARVFDVTGREVVSLEAGGALSTAGGLPTRHVTWDLRDARGGMVRPGVYWMRYGGAARKVIVAP